VKGGVISRTLLRNEGMRHPSNFRCGLNRLRCDAVVRDGGHSAQGVLGCATRPPPPSKHARLPC
jgi:hypothetical protein